jgi:hypothetical protein
MNQSQDDSLRGVGFPDFWETAYSLHPLFYKAATNLIPLQNIIFKKPVAEPLHKVIRSIARIVANSLGALTVLTLNGYGVDALRVARSMFEGEVTALFLKSCPEQIRDYLDYMWVIQNKRLQYFKGNDQLGKRFTPEAIRNIETNYERVKPQFNRKGKMRPRWSRFSLAEMAEKAGLGDLYGVIYPLLSSIHHHDISGLSSQAESKSIDMEVAPSDNWLGLALMTGHSSVVRVLSCFNEVAKLGLDAELQSCEEAFVETWKKS